MMRRIMSLISRSPQARAATILGILQTLVAVF
jgi:hypothetical protein